MAEAVAKLRNDTLTRPELDDLSRHFFPLARNIARRFAFHGKEEDFVSAGYYGIAYALMHAANKMFDDDLESWVKSCIYRFIRNQRVTDHLVCVPNTTLRDARERGDFIQLLKGHSLGYEAQLTQKKHRVEELLEFLDESAVEELDKEIIVLRVEGYTYIEIGEIVGKSKSDIHRRCVQIERRFNKLMGKK